MKISEELKAMTAIHKILENVERMSRQRILAYFISLYLPVRLVKHLNNEASDLFVPLYFAGEDDARLVNPTETNHAARVEPQDARPA